MRRSTAMPAAGIKGGLVQQGLQRLPSLPDEPAGALTYLACLCQRLLHDVLGFVCIRAPAQPGHHLGAATVEQARQRGVVSRGGAGQQAVERVVVRHGGQCGTTGVALVSTTTDGHGRSTPPAAGEPT